MRILHGRQKENVNLAIKKGMALSMKLLPFTDRPIFTCYHNKAFPSGIIQANSPEDITKWVCAKCVNCIYVPEGESRKFEPVGRDLWGYSEGVITQQILKIKKELIQYVNNDLVSMFKVFIDNGCYIHGVYNEEYIPCMWAYGRKRFVHDFLVIGYDENVFYLAGYTSDPRFKRFTVPIHNFMEGLFSGSSSKININFLSYNHGVVLKPNIGQMILDLGEYISTENYMDPPTPEGHSYGIATLMRVRDLFIDEVVNQKIFHISPIYTRVLCEHEWVLKSITESFLSDKEKNEYMDYAAQNLNYANTIHMLGLKMRYTGNAKLIENITTSMNAIIENEMQYIPGLIELLKTKYADHLIL